MTNGIDYANLAARKSAVLVVLALTSLAAAPVAAQSTTADEATSDDTAAPSEGDAVADGTEAATTDEAAESEDDDGEGADTLATPAPDATALSAPDEEEAEEEEGARTEEEAEAAQAAAEPLAWRNSFLTITGGTTFNSFCRDCQLSYNPYVYAGFTLSPRWYLAPTLFFAANLSAFYEFTDSDSDTYNHEIGLTDATLDLRYTAVVDRFVFIPTVRLTFPTSKLSQGAQRYFNTGVGLTAVLQIPEFLSSNLALGFAYRRWWAGSNVPLVMSPRPGDSALTSANTGVGPRLGGAGRATDGEVGAFTDSTGGAASAADRIVTSLTLNVTPTSGLTLTLQGVLVWDRAFDNSAAYLDCNVVASIPCNTSLLVEQSSDNYRWRWFSVYTFQAAYDVLAWFNLSLGVSNATALAPFWNDNGTVRSPFSPDTQVFLSGTFTLDGIYEELTRGAEEDDGLTPEERQRRRQGLAALEAEILEEVLSAQPPTADGEDEEELEAVGSSPARSTVAF